MDWAKLALTVLSAAAKVVAQTIDSDYQGK